MTKNTRKLLTVKGDAKTIHSLVLGIITGVQYLAPNNESGIINLCIDATPGCIEGCLFTSGRAEFDPKIAQARILRTIMFVQQRPEYWTKLIREIQALIRKGDRENLIPAVRLNGTSDLPWERMKIRGTGTEFDGLTIFQAFPNLQFYDYTKTVNRCGNTPDNYHMTASYSEHMTPETMDTLLEEGHNVAVVFRVCEHQGTCGCILPTTWKGYDVINGDASDVRFGDPHGVIVGLKAKGRARDDYAGFVIRI